MPGLFDPAIFDPAVFDESGNTVTATATDAPTTSDAATRTGVFARTATESIATSDSAVVASVARTTTDAPTTADVASRIGSLHRTDTEVPTTADAAVQVKTISRSTTDAPTTSDTASRAVTLHRATADAPHTSDVAVGAVNGYVTTDAPHTSDTATRVALFHRSIADAPAIAQSVVRVGSFHRTATEAFTSADVAVRGPNRFVTDNPHTSDVATLSGALHRTTADAISASVSAIQHNTPFYSGTAIYIDGVNVAKPDGDPVVYATARFMSAVNGVAGEASFRLRDDTGTASYKPGDPLELVIDGNRVWTGFVTNVKRVYAFPALNIAEFGPTRFFDIEGTDLNILFNRRIVAHYSGSLIDNSPLYGPHTPDSRALSDLFTGGWLDLSGDGLDTTTGVLAVADITEDQNGRAFFPSDTWNRAMLTIASLPGAIWYIRPNWEVAYVDDDTPDAPFGLSDVPDGITTKGYREMEVLFDGTNLANDVLALGAGYGSNKQVVERLQDATSIADHGVWQLGSTTFGVYKQATINRIADSIVNGSPEHHRGQKDDRRAVTVTTFEPGLLPAQKVPFYSEVFGYSEVLPIRKMEVTFPTPTTPRYDLTLSYEIDAPFSFFDPFRFTLPQLPGLPPFGVPPFPPVTLPSGCECSTTDDFNRTVGSGLGTSTMGSTWNADAGCSVAAGVATIPNGSFAELTTYSPSTDVSVILTVTGTPSGTSNAGIFGGEANTTGHPTTHDFFELDIYPTGQIELFSRDDDQLVTPGIDFTQPFNCRFLFTASTIDLYMWAVGGSQPGSPTLSLSNPNGFRPDYDLYAGNYGSDAAITMASLDAKNMDRCLYPQFDAMHRADDPGWGNADSGNPWVGVAGAHGGTAYVHDVQSDAFFPSAGGGIVTDLHLNGLGTALLGQAYTLTTPPPWGNDQSAPAFTLRSRLLVRNVAPSPYTLRFTWAIGGVGVQFVIVDGGSTVLLNTTEDSDGPVSYDNWGGTDSFSQFMNNVELQYDSTGFGTVNFRIWPDGEARPDLPTLSATMGGDLITGDLLITQAPDEPSGAFLTPTTWTTWWHYFDFTDYSNRPCFVGGPPPGPGGPAYGPIGAEILKFIDSTHFQMAASSVPGTVRVYAGTPGKLLLPVMDYVADNTTGIVTLVQPAAAGTVSASYTAAGPSPMQTPANGTIVITAAHTVIENMSFVAPASNGGLGTRTTFIYAEGTAASPIDDIIIRNCSFTGGTIGIWLRHCTNVQIINCTFNGMDYAGIDFWSVIHGTITGNMIQNIGATRTDFTDPAFQNNAYGIILNRQESASLVTDPNTKDILVQLNTVTNVPIWMGMNTHGGEDITFDQNQVSLCPRAIFSAGSPFPGGSGITTPPINIKVTNNTLTQCTTKAGGTTQKIGILYAGWVGTQITGNNISVTYTDADIYEYIGDGNDPATGVTVSGNNLIA